MIDRQYYVPRNADATEWRRVLLPHWLRSAPRHGAGLATLAVARKLARRCSAPCATSATRRSRPQPDPWARLPVPPPRARSAMTRGQLLP